MEKMKKDNENRSIEPPIASKLAWLETDKIIANPHNPRYFFHEETLRILKESINEVGILVPLLIYQRKTDGQYIILDGERRWRCAKNLDLKKIPANIIPEPTKLSNILTMFSIHNVREPWELMPTALKLEVIIRILKTRDTKKLSQLTGLTQTNVERCKKLLSFDKKYQDMMLAKDNEKIKADFFIEMYSYLSNVIFIPFGDEGKSGHSTLTTFRRANNLSSSRYNEKFKHLSQITDFVNIKEVLNETKPPEEQENIEEIEETEKLIFIDDFIGSGQQAIRYFVDNINPIIEILPEEIEIYLALLVGYEDGINSFEIEINRSVIVIKRLDDRDKLFSPMNKNFSDREKEILRGLCKNAGDFPTGFNNIQSTVIFHYRSPNNTISILRCNNNNWKGLFPRKF